VAATLSLGGSSLKIGIMLRSIDERQGIGVYSRNLVDELLAMDRRNEYKLFYRDPSHLGFYSRYANVREIAIKSPNKFLWDQVAIPIAAYKENLDILFHTKFTVPLLASCKTVMTIHGASWFVHPELYTKLDIAYIRAAMPFYCRKAAAILSNSALTTDDFIRFLNIPSEKLHTIPLGTSRDFRPIDDQLKLKAVCERYGLPRNFVLTVIKYDPRKNFSNLIAAFRILRQRLEYKMVVVGINCRRYIGEHGLDQDGILNDLVFLDWVNHDDLPAIYNLATCLFFPSVYEEFGLPSCEAMACGCPPVVSNTGALPDNVGEAGLIVNPFNPNEMADALERICANPELRADLARKSIERAKYFTWERCAKQTLDVLEGLVNEPTTFQESA
jgi:glycosyltransferase involved in cell wall biosynthesis